MLRDTRGNVRVKKDTATGRLRILKLEDRIAPKGNNCQGGSCDKHGNGRGLGGI